MAAAVYSHIVTKTVGIPEESPREQGETTMGKAKQISPKEHKKQICLYVKEHRHYVTYANVLRRILEDACEAFMPEAIVQARAKTVASFAEKCARRFETYPDGVRLMTDLCGARVIVHTLEQVRAIRQFIKAHFDVTEEEDVQKRLGEREAGYLSVHFTIQMKKGSSPCVTARELRDIGDRRAEIQVRTLLQHAWADILHDRLYKRNIPSPRDLKRTGNMLAAVMEEGDRAFGDVARRIDAFLGSYSAYMNREQILDEIVTQETILAGEEERAKGGPPDEAAKAKVQNARLALGLARLYAALGKYKKVVALLPAHTAEAQHWRPYLQFETASALCHLYRKEPGSSGYEEANRLLGEICTSCERNECKQVRDLRKNDLLHAQALSLKARLLESLPRQAIEARKLYRHALSLDGGNPYLLAESLRCEVLLTRKYGRAPATCVRIDEAVKTCAEHGRARMELPRAWFTQARLLLLEEKEDDRYGSLVACLKGIQHYLDPDAFSPPETLAEELDFLDEINTGRPWPQEHTWIRSALELAGGLREPSERPAAALPAVPISRDGPILIVAGGASAIDPPCLALSRSLIRIALDDFAGTVIAGGTVAGIPGCVGEVAAKLRARGRKRFRLVGYHPGTLPSDGALSPHYDHLEPVGKSQFSPAELLQNWADLLATGIQPSQVRLLGFNGGPLSAVEFRLALALGAKVGVVAGTGRAADELIKDETWADSAGLLVLPPDPATVYAFTHGNPVSLFTQSRRERLGRRVHENYVEGNTGTSDPSMLPWRKLDPGLCESNCQQIDYATQILACVGFAVKPAGRGKTGKPSFTKSEVEIMAQMEHGRWNAERLVAGWKYGRPKDVARKINPNLVPWAEVPKDVREFDYLAVRGWPEIFESARLRIVRLRNQKKIFARTRELLKGT